MIVRRVEWGSQPDYETLLDLRRRVLRYPLGLDLTPDDIAGERGDTFFAAYADDRLVGCLVMTPKPAGSVKMRQVAVEPDLQAQGIGRAMVEACEAWARQQGFTRIELSARDSAVPFYERLGYSPEGEPFVEVFLPHQLMVKSFG